MVLIYASPANVNTGRISSDEGRQADLQAMVVITG